MYNYFVYFFVVEVVAVCLAFSSSNLGPTGTGPGPKNFSGTDINICMQRRIPFEKNIHITHISEKGRCNCANFVISICRKSVSIRTNAQLKTAQKKRENNKTSYQRRYLFVDLKKGKSIAFLFFHLYSLQRILCAFF